jgi:hypothetical protein
MGSQSQFEKLGFLMPASNMPKNLAPVELSVPIEARSSASKCHRQLTSIQHS